MIQQIKASGQVVPEDQILSYMKSEFEGNLIKNQGAVFAQYGFDEESVKAGVKKHGADEAVAKAIGKLKQLHAIVDPAGPSAMELKSGASGSATKGPEIPKDLTLERMIDIVGVYMMCLTTTMRSVVTDFKSKGANIADQQVVSQIEVVFSRLIEGESEKALLEEGGVSLAIFQAGMAKYQQEPSMMQRLQQLHLMQQEEFREMGLPTA
jgi:hypothetical protein